MPLIKTIAPEEATGKVSEIYNAFKGSMGFVPNAFKIRSISPDILENQAKLLYYFWHHETLSNNLLAFIRLLVSTKHSCKYCVDLNIGLLMQGGVSLEDIQATKDNPINAPLNDNDKAMLLFVVKLVDNAHSINADDIEELRNLGWSDKDIHDAATHGTSQISTDMIFDAFKIEKD